MTSAKPRARDLGLPLAGKTGRHNAITDVPGVLVGFTTINRNRTSLEVGAGPVHTGVTAILPRGRKHKLSPAWAGHYNLNGNGEMTGTGLLFGGYMPVSGKETPAFSFNGLFRQRKAMLALCGCLFFFFNVGCIWGYLERIGSAADFSAQALGNGLAFGVSIGMVGALTASWQGTRTGRVVPLVIGTIGTVMAVAALVPEASLAIFVPALALYNFAWNYSLAYQYAVVAAADDSGRCIAAAPAFHAAGGAIGPAVAAMLITPGSLLAVNVLAAASVLVSLVLFLPAARLKTGAG